MLGKIVGRHAICLFVLFDQGLLRIKRALRLQRGIVGLLHIRGQGLPLALILLAGKIAGEFTLANREVNLVKLRERLRCLYRCEAGDAVGELDSCGLSLAKNPCGKVECRLRDISRGEQVGVDLRKSLALCFCYLPFRFQDIELGDVDRPVIVQGDLYSLG